MMDPISAGLAKAGARAATRFAVRRLMTTAVGSPQEQAFQRVLDKAKKRTAARLAPGEQEYQRHLETLIEFVFEDLALRAALVAAGLERRNDCGTLETLAADVSTCLDCDTLRVPAIELAGALRDDIEIGLAVDAGLPESPLSTIVLLSRTDELLDLLKGPEPPSADQIAALSATEAERDYARLVSDERLREWSRESPLEPHWRAFADARNWQRDAEDAVQAVIRGVVATDHLADSTKTELLRLCQLSDFHDEPRIILARLRAIADFASRVRVELRRSGDTSPVDSAVNHAFGRVATIATTPRFRRCLLITGSSGEGKTHFVGARLQDAAENPDRIIVLRLPAPSSTESLQMQLRGRAQSATMHPWATWRELAEHADAHGKLLVCIVEDVERWLDYDPRSVDLLIEEIAESSRHGSVRWLITAGLSALDRAIAHRDFWTRYGWDDIPRGKRTQAFRSVDGWHVLDPLNEMERTGIEILRQLEEDTPAIVAQDDIAEPEVLATARRLSVPLSAWLVRDLSAELDESLASLIDIGSVELIAKFGSALYERAGRASATPSDNFRATMALAADVFCDHPDTEIPLGSLAASVVERGRAQDSIVQDHQTADAALSEALRVGLLAWSRRDDLAAPEPVVAPRFEFVWEWLIAERLVRRSGGPTRVDVQRLIGAVQQIPNAGRRERVVGLALLIADAENRVVEAISPIWAASLVAPSLPDAGVWFAAGRASASTQKALVRRARKQDPNVLNRRTAFALTYFLGEAGAAAVPAVRALLAFQPYFGAVGRHSLDGYFSFVVERLLNRIETEQDILHALRALHGSEDAAPPGPVASIALDVAIRLCERPADIVRLTLTFLRGLPAFPHAPPLSIFSDCFMQQAVKSTIDRLGTEAYSELRRQGWYDPSGEGKPIGNRLGRRMLTEANTAFGAWFQRQPDADYVELVARLARGPADGGTSTPRDRANAVYLILHSVHSDTLKHDCAVNPRFRQPLALLVKDNDPMVRNAVVKHSRLFETNLDLPPLIK